jgi:MFS family permease
MGLSPTHVGLVFLIAPVIMVIASPVTGWLYDRYESRYLSAIGIALSGVSLLCISIAALTRDLTLIVLCFVPMAVGSALFQSPNNTEIMRGLPIEKLGIASSLSATIRDLGMTLGVSFASILLIFELHTSGYFGPIASVSPNLFAYAISEIIVIGAVLCFIGMGFCLLRNADE